MEIKNALIESTMLGTQHHGIMSFYLYLDYGDGGHQGAGGYSLDSPKKDIDNNFTKREGTAIGLSCIMRVMDVVGVSKWEDLPGKYIRVKSTWNKVEAIGNLLKDDWMNFEDFFKTNY